MTLACRESRVHAVQPFHTMHFGAKYRHLHTRLAALRARRSERRSRALSHVKMPSQNRLPHEPTLRRPDNASDARRARIVTVTHNQSLTPPHNQAVAPRRPHQIGYPLGRQSGASCGNIFECFDRRQRRVMTILPTSSYIIKQRKAQCSALCMQPPSVPAGVHSLAGCRCQQLLVPPRVITDSI